MLIVSRAGIVMLESEFVTAIVRDAVEPETNAGLRANDLLVAVLWIVFGTLITNLTLAFACVTIGVLAGMVVLELPPPQPVTRATRTMANRLETPDLRDDIMSF